MLLPLLDTSIGTLNLGDRIIMDAVEKELRALLPQDFFQTFATHEPLSMAARRRIAASSYCIVGGTNLLSSAMNDYRQWMVTLWDSLWIGTAVLMGVGWWQYQNRPNQYTTILLRRLLHTTMQHSVRDSYTAGQLAEAGIKNVLMTGCPTMWGLSEQLCNDIPGAKGEAVVITLTDYMKDIEADQLLIKTVAAAYRTVYFWPQGAADLAYISALADGSSNMVLLPSSLQAFDALLASQGSVDYVGTRLHAGIRALQHRRRTTIIAIDNRATEMGKDFGLPVIPRTETAALADVIRTSLETNIQLPWEAIRQWKSQFVPPDAKSLFE